MSQDPLGYDGGDANLYRYGGNDVTNEMDPSGDNSAYSAPVMLPSQLSARPPPAPQQFLTSSCYSYTKPAVPQLRRFATRRLRRFAWPWNAQSPACRRRTKPKLERIWR